jgi:RNA polymerase sigma-70 factor, ECF subfamily
MVYLALNVPLWENFPLVDLNEPEYQALISHGDKNAYELMFRTYYEPLCIYACSFVKNIDDAEEVVQNVFFNIWNKRNALQIDSSVKSYLYRSVRNDCLNKIKHDKVRTVYASDYKKTTQHSYDDSSKLLEAKELNSQINLAIESLPKQCGEVFRMSRFGHLKYSEIAQELQISVKTVEAHMGKAMRILREKLKDYLPLLIWLLSIYRF